MLFTLCAIFFIYETGPIQWMFNQRCEYWWPGASVATVLTTHPCVSQCLRVKSLRPNDALWWQTFVSALAQVMARGLTAPSYHLKQCWLVISMTLWHSSEGIIIIRSLNTMWCHYNTVFSKILTKTPHSSPMRARYEVFVVILKSDSLSAVGILVLYVIPW